MKKSKFEESPVGGAVVFVIWCAMILAPFILL